MDEDTYKDALRRFASGVTIVTVAHEGTMHGMTASSFASVSLRPPLVLVSLEKDSRTHRLVLETGRFGVNVLAIEQEGVARRFSQHGDKSFEEIPHRIDGDGVPLLDDAIAVMTCLTTTVVDGGDHNVFLAEVLSATTRAGSPLLYYDRNYRSIEGV